MIAIHPYLRYAQALLLVENGLVECPNITIKHIKNEIEKGLDSFRIEPAGSITGKSSAIYRFCKEEKGNTETGVFLSPNVITTDKLAKNTWKAAFDLLKEINDRQADKSDDLTMSIVPTSGEYLSFNLNGGIGRGKPKYTLTERGLGIISTLTKFKPCLVSTNDWVNICLIPDLSIDKLTDFIVLFKVMLYHNTSSDLMIGKIEHIQKGRGENITNSYKPKRPLLFKGNFPDPPRSSTLGSISLLSTIGEFTRQAEYSEQALRVLDSLKNTEMYLIKYGGATVFTYNHYVIDLAKEGRLRRIVDSIYYSQLYRGKRFGNKDKNFDPVSEYQKFDLFTSRFLQLFNHAAFKDFLSFRAEYPHEVTTLFNTYFTKMEKIDLEIVQSARILGKWLNKVAYFAAKNEVKQGSPNYWEELRKEKSKILVTFESSIFSAKSGHALLCHIITIAGRSSLSDAPEKVSLFMEKTASGDLPLDAAKNLLIAFSRLINKSEKNEKKEAGIELEVEDEEDLSNE